MGSSSRMNDPYRIDKSVHKIDKTTHWGSQYFTSPRVPSKDW